jgi:hypothetical protein
MFETQAELVARQPRLSNGKSCRADFQFVADVNVRFQQALSGQVLAEIAECQGT